MAKSQRASRAFLRELNGYGVRAVDGEIGKIVDSLFDDVEWIVRYFVVDTGPWLRGRRVLIDRTACDRADWRERVLVTNRRTEQLEKTLSADSRLRGMSEFSGCNVLARNSNIGQVVDLLVREETWTIQHIVVDTGTWLSSRKILVPCTLIDHVDWPGRAVAIARSIQRIEEAGPVYDPAAAIRRSYEK